MTAAPPLSDYLPPGTDLRPTGDIAGRIERAPDGSLVVRGRDAWGWTWTGAVVEAEIEGRRGWSFVLALGETPEAFRLPGETPMRELEAGEPRATRGKGPRVAK